MKFLQILVLMFGLFIVGNGQVDCAVSNKIIVQDYDGKIVSNAKIDLLKVGKNFDQTKVFSPQQNKDNEFVIKTFNGRILTDTKEFFYINENYRLRINAENFKESELSIEFKGCATQPLKFVLEKIKQDIKLTGVVYDENGALIPGVSVIATDRNGQTFQTKTNDDGIYVLKLFPDTYKLEFGGQFFRKVIMNDFYVVNSTYGKINQDVILKIIDICGVREFTIIDHNR